jgi:RNA polymerase sigma-70 factor (ECF subfamily)
MLNKDDQAVLDQTMSGNTNAFSVIVRRYERPIFNLMFRMTRCDQTAADLTQEAFVKAYEKIGRFKRGKKFFPWLYSIGLNVAKDYLRKRRTQGEFSLEFDHIECLRKEYHSDAIEERILRNQYFREIDKSLSKLPISYREAVILRYHEELSVKDVADAIGIRLSAAKMRIKRGLAMLRNELGENFYEREKQIGKERSRIG